MLKIERLFPDSREGWLVWFFLVSIIFPLYYVYAYPRIANYFEETRWVECQMGKVCGRFGDFGDGRGRVFVRAPRYVAGFAEMPLEVGVENTSTHKLDVVVVSVEITQPGSLNQRVYIRALESNIESVMPPSEATPGYLRNSVALSGIPPYGKASALFMVRVLVPFSDQSKCLSPSQTPAGCSYSIKVLADGQETSQPINFTIEFNPSKVLQLQLLRYFLLPPGSNFFIPLILLLYISYVEFFLTREKEKKPPKNLHNEGVADPQNNGEPRIPQPKQVRNDDKGRVSQGLKKLLVIILATVSALVVVRYFQLGQYLCVSLALLWWPGIASLTVAFIVELLRRSKASTASEGKGPLASPGDKDTNHNKDRSSEGSGVSPSPGDKDTHHNGDQTSAD